MDYSKGFKRIYTVLTICWLAVCLFAGVWAISKEGVSDEGVIVWLGLTVVPPILAYVLCCEFPVNMRDGCGSALLI